MLAVIYKRVSTEDQARHGYSLEAQEEACRASALSLGATEALIFADEGVSGEILDRPGLRKALECLAQKRSDGKAFICLDPDRLARKLAHQLVLTERIEKMEAQLEFVNFEWKDTPEGKLFYSLRGAIAEYEKEKIKSRTRMGKIAKAKKGEKTHHLPTYGYREEPGRLVIDEKTALVVRQMFEWAAAGDGPYVIAKRLNDDVPSPRGGKWYRGVVARILKNPTYTGKVYVNKYDCSGLSLNKHRPKEARGKKRLRPEEEWILLTVPTIVEPELWERAQLARGRRRRIINERFLLSGIVRCGNCGSPIWSTSYKNKNGKRYRYYLCSSKRNAMDVKEPVNCDSPYTPAEELEGTVWAMVVNWLSNPDALTEEMGSDVNREQMKKEIASGVEGLNRLEKEKRRAYEIYVKGFVEEELYLKKIKEIATQKEKLTIRLDGLYRKMESIQSVENNKEALKKLADFYLAKITELTFEEKSRLVHMLVEKVVVTGNRVEITGRVPREICRYKETPIVMDESLCYNL